MIIEIISGIFSHSLSMIADSAHMFIDSSALIIGLIKRNFCKYNFTEKAFFSI